MAISRRRLLQVGSGVGVASAFGSTLFVAGCGRSGDSTPQTPVGPPRRGGTLRVGVTGTAGAITRDPFGVQNNDSDYQIMSLVYDTLTVPGAAPNVAPRLATRWEPSADLRRWRFELAEGVRFHDGSPLTSEDVVWSMRRLRESAIGASRLPGIEGQNITADGPRAVVVESSYPNAEIPVLMRLTTFILKAATTEPADAPGTGPFKLEWFRDGNARLVRNDEWFGGPVYLDAIEIRRFDKSQAITNALLSGEIDVASNVGTVAARLGEGRDGVKIVRRGNDTALAIVMRTADRPYADPRVREAFRLGVDRQAMVDQVLGGYGAVANDILGTADSLYARDLPQRKQDLVRARALLDAAGFDRSQTHKLVTTDQVPSLAESATMFAQQMKSIGVQIEVVKQESSTFLGKSKGKAPLYTTFWGTNDSVAYDAAKLMLSDSPVNEAAWHDREFDDTYRNAISAPDAAARRQFVHDLQKIQYDRSGYLLWGMADGMDLAKTTVQGLPELPGYGRVQLERAWFSG